jgi:1-acyl-sn-glycerol-3-phosphate acyltransferase
MLNTIKSALIWVAIAVLLIVWLPMMAIVRLFERDKSFYKTGYLFRKVGKAMTKLNPNWTLTITGKYDYDMRNPYVVVSNHLSQADIPLISNLPWEMKWVAKKELFAVPIVGWMMQLAGDIPVDRKAANRRIATLRRARYYLQNKCSVMFFPEGTRSKSGQLRSFSKGAFRLAIQSQTPVLPLAIDGTQDCLPKHSWKFDKPSYIRLKVLAPIPTKGLTMDDLDDLTNQVRSKIRKQLAEWRGLPEQEVDQMV